MISFDSYNILKAPFEAVRMMEGSYPVIGGAGNGKTRILVYRVAHPSWLNKAVDCNRKCEK